MVLFAALVLAAFGLVRGGYHFLALEHREKADILVVEGWVHDFAIQVAVKEFNTGTYQHVYTTGGPVSGTGGFTSIYTTSANVALGRLKKAGIPEDKVQMAPSKIMGHDRTYSAAVALRDTLREQHLEVHSLNIITENVHARRSRLLYEKAFDGKVDIGVIPVPSPDYDASHWWRYSEGVKDVISEGAAYLYARLFFHP